MTAATAARAKLVADLREAARFLDLMAEGGGVTFQTFPEAEGKTAGSARILHGDLADCGAELQHLNRAGAGVFWMVNTGDGVGRKATNVTGVRSLFVDLDGAPLDPVLEAGIEPHAVVQSSPGRWHAYWLVTGCALPEFTLAQAALAAKFNGDPQVTDLPRVLRLPGFWHLKDEPFRTRVHMLQLRQPYPVAELVERLALRLQVAPPAPPARLPAAGAQIMEGGRRNHLRTALADLNWRGMSAEAIRVELDVRNQRECSPPLPADELDGLVQDWMRRYGAQNGRDRSQGDVASAPRPGYVLIPASQVAAFPPPRWALKGVQPEAGVGCLFGDAGTGKTFLAFSLAAALATEAEDVSFHGYRRPQRRPVVYVGLEGSGGLTLRAQAYAKAHGALPDALHFVLRQPFTLDGPGDAARLCEAIRATLGTDGPPPTVFIDTLARASGGRDERASEDMNVMISAASLIAEETAGFVWLVHHTGHAAQERARGASNLHGAMDVELLVSRASGGVRTWRVMKQKDGADGMEHAFELEVVDLGHDEDGDPITSCVVRPFDGAQVLDAPKLTPRMHDALQAYRAAAQTHGLLDGAGCFAGLHVEAWRPEFYRASTADNRAAKKVAFQRARGDLVRDGWLSVDGDVYRLAGPSAGLEEAQITARLRATRRAEHTGTVPEHPALVPPPDAL